MEPMEVEKQEDCVSSGPVTDPNSPGCKQKLIITTEAKEESAQGNALQKKMTGFPMMVARYFGDVQKSQGIVLGIGSGAALVLGFVWILLLRFFGGIMVWVSIKLCLISMVGLTVFLWDKSGKLGPALNSVQSQMPGNATATPSWASGTGGENAKMFEYAAYASTVLTLVAILMVIYLRKQIMIAIGIIKEASKCIAKMPSLVLFPLFTFTLVVGLSAYWIVVAAYLQTASSISFSSISNSSKFASTIPSNASMSNSTVSGFNFGAMKDMNIIQWLQVYHFFGFFWTNQFIQAIGITTIAGAVCSWYWVQDKDDTPRLPVLQALKRTLIYHLGSIAFGSFIVAAIQLARFILAYLDKKSKRLQDANVAIKIAFKVVACCLWCFEKCVKFINKNAFILIAMMGWPFCKATKNAVVLLMKNVKQIGTTNMISTLMMYMGKFCISTICGIVSFLILSDPKVKADLGLESAMFPALITMLLSYFVATSFLEVYDMSIDTILLCFCLDRANNDGSPDKPYFMSDHLRKFVQATVKHQNAGKGKKKKKQDDE